MSSSPEPLTPCDIENYPELPIIEALAHQLQITGVTLQAHFPEICAPDWPLGSRAAPNPSSYAASVVFSLAQALTDAIRVYRESIARERQLQLRASLFVPDPPDFDDLFPGEHDDIPY